MTINSLNSVFSSLATYSADTRLSSGSGTVAQTTTGTLPSDAAPDLSTLSSYMKQLQDLQTSDNSQFKQLTATIAQKLSDAASSAAASGDSQDAGKLNDLAAKFKASSETGQMPQLGGRHHHHHTSAVSSDTSSTDTNATASNSSDSLTAETSKMNQLLAMFGQNNSTDPMSTLTSVLQSVLSSTQQS